VTSSNNGWLTSQCPSLLGVTAASANLTLNYHLLLDKFRFIKTFTDIGLSIHSQIQVYQDIIIKHRDKNWLNTSCTTSLNTCSHRQVFIIKHHTSFGHNTSFLYTSWYIYKHPQISYEFLAALLILILCNHIAQEIRSCDHQEYGTHHETIYIHAWGSDKALLELS
jgi:hypothetical protein